MKRVELLSPAKNLVVGLAAIRNGADAVYIGAPAFGARKSAANSMEDIRQLVEYAHRFYCRVFVTLNTILYDHELTEAEKMIHDLYRIGVDALIIQDLGILRMNLPPICLHASTQMHNYDLDKLRFLDRLGFRRIVLARELSLEQLRTIRGEVKTELEVFIHGALCVSLSGQCYLSQYMFGRSANRGECAQPCRMKWSVKDSNNKPLVEDKYVLSLKDLNLSTYINDLLKIGIDSFKIEGRLKDENYVANVTNYYSSLINCYPGIERVGSGQVTSAFRAEPERSFNRGYSVYFMEGRTRGLVNPDTPKSMGKYIGRVIRGKGNTLEVDSKETIHNGDGLCYFDQGELKGLRVNSVEGSRIICNETVKILPDTKLYRNYDHQFVTQIKRNDAVRKIRIRLEISVQQGQLSLKVIDEDGVEVFYTPEERYEKADHPVQRERLKQQLMKCGDTDYVCEKIEYESEEILFIPTSVANAIRRTLLEKLTAEREKKRERLLPVQENVDILYEGEADWHLNVVNHKSAVFYQEHGITNIEPGFEVKTGDKQERDLMHTRYCILHELGRCRKNNKNEDLSFPLFICNDKHQFRLEFDCKNCFMKIIGNC